MREIQGISNEPEARRRWFHDNYFDLFVWQIASGDITRFQLCYGINTSERALVWDRNVGFFHDGEEIGASGARDVIGAGAAPGKPPTADPVFSRFKAIAGSLPEDIHQLVAVRILEYVEKKPLISTRRKRFRRANWQQNPPERS
jgi:hypothetical protein